MESTTGMASTSQGAEDVQHAPAHVILPKHAHHLIRHNLKRKRATMDKRDGALQTALDVIVVSPQGTTVGDVLLASIPSDPTTASLPGFGPLTLSSFIPSTPTAGLAATAATVPTTDSVSQSSPAPTAAASASSLTPSMTRLNGTSSSTSSSVAFNVGIASDYPSNFSSTTLPSSALIFASTRLLNSSTSSSTTSFTTSSSSFSSLSSFSSTSTFSSATVSSSSGALVGGGGVATEAPAPSSAAPSGSDNNGSSISPQAGPIAGGVVGGVAGAALFAVLIFVLLRWYRQRQSRGQRLLGSPTDEEASSAPGNARSPPRPMTQRSSITPLAAAVRRFRPDSMQTASTATAGAPSERGFQRISGRKLNSVLQSGGDGYDEPGRPDSVPVPPAVYGVKPSKHESNFSGSSFYRDSNSHYGGGIDSQLYESGPIGAAGPTTRQRNVDSLTSDNSMRAAGPSSTRGSATYDSPAKGNPFATPDARADRALHAFSSSPDSLSSDGVRSPTPDAAETLTVHQGPIRTPIITGGNTPPRNQQRHRPDGVGRSRPSLDASRNSRFSEAL